jgi:hypothetical protein
MQWLRIGYDVPNYKHDKRRKYGWQSFETFPKGMLVECWMTDEDKPSIWLGTSRVEDPLVERALLSAGEPAVGQTFDEIKRIEGYTYYQASTVVDYAMKQGWLTKDQVIQALKSDD